jgi:adenine-specific DNA-methyltransferase
MYPRLKLARNLLKDDGVIFISIDDNEVHNLRKICDEVFGEGNFISEFAWRRTDNQSNIGNSAKVKEYILCYSKQKENFKLNKIPLSKKAIAEYSYEDKYGKFRRKNILDKSRGKKIYNIETPNGNILNGPWMIDEKEFEEFNVQGKIYWASGKMPYGKKYLHEADGQIISDWLSKEFGTNQRGSGEMEKLFNKRVFDFPKPTQLIKTFVTIGSNKNDFILDFFAGSGTTADAVMQLNAEDKGERKYICVQIPEKTDEKSEAFKAGYKNICEIGKERIRRAGEKIKSEMAELAKKAEIAKKTTSEMFANSVHSENAGGGAI